MCYKLITEHLLPNSICSNISSTKLTVTIIWTNNYFLICTMDVLDKFKLFFHWVIHVVLKYCIYGRQCCRNPKISLTGNLPLNHLLEIAFFFLTTDKVQMDAGLMQCASPLPHHAKSKFSWLPPDLRELSNSLNQKWLYLGVQIFGKKNKIKTTYRSYCTIFSILNFLH